MMKWPPRFLVCRCGEAFPFGDMHECRPKAVRKRETPELYRRWLDPRTCAETERELSRLGRDPAFAPGTEQRAFYD